jgi:phosphopantothenoylcysteine decarboxylase / phosphopantothenate---cysteine ligase
MTDAPCSKRILLIIGGGVAAYKSLELIRLLKRRGVATTAILTRAGAEFVTALSISALSGEKTYTDLFSLTDEVEMGHIELSRMADLVAVVPATADLMARAAHGHASDLATTALLATDKPVVMAPSMNVRMWLHPATQRNLATLKADGVMVLEPEEGEMACGEFGPGRLAGVERIAEALVAHPALSGAPSRLVNKRIVLTAGPTQEPLDPVRYLSNHSSGKQGYALAEALVRLGAEVTLISGPSALPVPFGLLAFVSVQTAIEMKAAVEAALPADAYIGVAAVADYRIAEPAEVKRPKDERGFAALRFVENPDILHFVAREVSPRPRLVIGFAAETHDVEEKARAKRARKGCDWIVANDVSGDVMGGRENSVHVFTASESFYLDRAPKDVIARLLADRIADAMNAQP